MEHECSSLVHSGSGAEQRRNTILIPSTMWPSSSHPSSFHPSFLQLSSLYTLNLHPSFLQLSSLHPPPFHPDVIPSSSVQCVALPFLPQSDELTSDSLRKTDRLRCSRLPRYPRVHLHLFFSEGTAPLIKAARFCLISIAASKTNWPWSFQINLYLQASTAKPGRLFLYQATQVQPGALAFDINYFLVLYELKFSNYISEVNVHLLMEEAWLHYLRVSL